MTLTCAVVALRRCCYNEEEVYNFDSKNDCSEEVLTCDAGVLLPVWSLEDALLQASDGDDGDGEPVLREDHPLGTRVGHVGGDGQEAGVVDTWTLVLEKIPSEGS